MHKFSLDSNTFHFHYYPFGIESKEKSKENSFVEMHQKNHCGQCKYVDDNRFVT